MKPESRVRVTLPGTSITGWVGTVTDCLADGSAGWVRFDSELPVSLRTSTKDKHVMFLTASQVEAVS